MRQVINYVLVILALWVPMSLAWAGKVSVEPDGSTKWQAGIDGVVIGWRPDGSINDVTSTYIQPVAFSDREGINKARVIAEEKAKAAIIRFMNQAVTTSRVVTTIDNDLSKSVRARHSGSKEDVRRTDTRTLVSAFTEVTTSFAKGTLPGVIVLGTSYSPKREEYSVTVGFSRKTMHAAAALRRMTTESSRSGAEPSGTSRESGGASSDKWLHQPASSRTYPNADWK